MLNVNHRFAPQNHCSPATTYTIAIFVPYIVGQKYQEEIVEIENS